MDIEYSMDQVFIKKVTDILEINLANEQFGVKELTREMGISRSKLHRKLNALIQKSTNQFIREYRLEKAMEMLKNDVATASEIAYRVGFNSPTYFNTCFHQYYGFPPGEVKFRDIKTSDQDDLSFIPNKTIKPERKTSVQKLALVSFLVIVLISVISYFIYSYATNHALTKTTEVTINNKSIAILPCKNLSDDKQNEYFADGVMGSIQNHLNKITDLKVISGTTMEKYRETTKTAPEIAEELNIFYLLEASVQRYGDKIRIITKLIDANNDLQIWSDTYDRDLVNIFAIQSEISKQIAIELKTTISPLEIEQIEKIPTKDIEAYDYYLKGLVYLNRSIEGNDFKYAFRMFEKAVEIDPEYTLAWVGLASSSRLLYWFNIIRTANHVQQTKLFLDKSIALDPNLMEVKLEAAWYYFHCELNYPKAIKIIEKLNSEYPNNADLYATIAWIYRRMGKFETFFEYMEKAILLDSSNWVFWMTSGETSIILSRYKDAEDYLKTGIGHNPSARSNYINLFTTYLCTGEVNKARELIENNPDIEFFLGKIKIKLIDRNFDEAISILESLPFEEFSGHLNFIPKSLFLGNIYNMKNDNESAKKYFLKAKQHLEKKLTELEEDSRIYSSLGIAYAGLNMPEKAMIANNKALALMNISKDAWKGFYRELDMAKILMMNGKHNEAIYKLKTLLQINGYLSVELLEKDPFWDPLRKFDNFNTLLKNPNYQVNLVNN